MDKLVEN